MLLISLFSFCCLIFRLGGTGLGLTEEVEDVGDLHRGELLAVLAVTGGGELLEKVGDALDPSHQACPRESKSSEFTVISVMCHSKAGYFQNGNQGLTIQKSETYDAKVSSL